MQSFSGFFLVERMSRIAKGMKKRPITRRRLSRFHDSVFRRMKYSVSSGMFAYQMSMYWLKPM